MNVDLALLTVAAVALLAGCPHAREPYPSGLPPEYESPRSYDPGKNIDTAGAEESDEIVDAPPPATVAPAPVEPPAAVEPAPAEPAGAGGSGSDSDDDDD